MNRKVGSYYATGPMDKMRSAMEPGARLCDSAGSKLGASVRIAASDANPRILTAICLNLVRDVQCLPHDASRTKAEGFVKCPRAIVVYKDH